MRKEVVPVDMSSEQKEIFGVVSKRQLIYLILGGSAIYSYVPKLFLLIGNWMAAIIICIVSTLPVVAAVLLFGFYRLEKYHMYLDKYLLIKLHYKTQLGNWSKKSRNLIEKDDLY
jgi:hypothetical protein